MSDPTVSRQVMDDKDVGEVWRQCIGHEDNRPLNYRGAMRLIRKLVEERCYRSNLDQALRDFGISRESWEAK